MIVELQSMLLCSCEPAVMYLGASPLIPHHLSLFSCLFCLSSVPPLLIISQCLKYEGITTHLGSDKQRVGSDNLIWALSGGNIGDGCINRVHSYIDSDD